MTDGVGTNGSLESLLVVQEHDSAIDALKHSRESMKERSELTALMSEGARLHAGLGELRDGRDAVLSEERRLDDEARSLSEKAKEMETRLYSGTISSPRELQAIQADVEQLKRHRTSLEDREIEVMEQRESLDAEVAEAEGALRRAAVEVERLQAVIAAAETEIDAQIAARVEARRGLVTALPGTLLADYERRRAVNRGVGAARLAGNTCQACRLSIPASEVDRIRHSTADTLAYCDNCGAILVAS